MFTQNTLGNTNVKQSKQAEYLNVVLFVKNEFVSILHEGLFQKQCRRQNTDLIKSMYVNKKCS